MTLRSQVVGCSRYFYSVLSSNPYAISPIFLMTAAALAVVLVVMSSPVLIATFRPWHPGQEAVFSDFMIHWEVGRLVADGRAADVYERAVLTESYIADFGMGGDFSNGAQAWSYIYPPVSLMFAGLLGQFSFTMAAVLMTMIGVVLFLRVAVNLLGVAGVIIALGAPAVWICLLNGQNSIIIAALLASVFLTFPQKTGRVSILVGVCSIKPHLLAVVPFIFVALRDWRAVWLTGLVVAGVIVLATALFGPSIWEIYFLQGLPDALRALKSPVIWPGMVSFYALFSMLGAEHTLALILQVLIGCGVVALTVQLFMRCADKHLRLAAALMAALLIPPMVYDYDMPISVLAILALLRHSGSCPLSRKEWGAIAAVYFLPHLFHSGLGQLFHFSLIPVVNASFFLLICYRASKDRSEQRYSSGLAS